MTARLPQTILEMILLQLNLVRRGGPFSSAEHYGGTLMNSKSAKAILVVSFGTSFEHSRKASIDAIETKIRKSFPDYAIYLAWTSRHIIQKLKQRDGIHVDTVPEALRRMASDGIRHVFVQPTHIINGIENEAMTAEILSEKDAFDSVRFGKPLLTGTEDLDAAVQLLADSFLPVEPDRMVVFMGHGTTHYANFVYDALNCRFLDMGYEQFLIGTVEGYPDIDTVLRRLKKKQPARITLAPFMIVAGDHAVNDMAGAEEGSWRNLLEKAGYEVDIVLKGLGEYPEIQDMFADHIRSALKSTR